MNEKWKAMTFEERQKLLRDMDAEDIKKTYGLNEGELRKAKEVVEHLPSFSRQKRLRRVSASPDKRSLREAGRDFNLTLIFAELIDNSIDRLCKGAPSKDDVLRISIDFDDVTNSCIYEDNAGGFQEASLVNFFKPGGTDNDPLGISIGSYAWGAKKARSALADSVDLITRAAKGPASLATIDDEWDLRDEDWIIRIGREGEEFTLSPSAQLERGHTRLVFKNLKPLVHPTPAALEWLRRDLGEIYGLLLKGHEDCPCKFKLKIVIQRQPVESTIEYRWTQYAENETDLHPRKYITTRKVRLPFVSGSVADNSAESGHEQEVKLVLEIGIKQDTTCGTAGISQSNLFDPADDWGIDTYGNGRLIERNVRQSLGYDDEVIGGEQAAKLVKGRLIIIGSSYAIPWDTHKTRIAPNHPTLLAINEAFRDLIRAWVKTAKLAAGRGSSKAINTKLRPFPWDGKWQKKDANGKPRHSVFQFDEKPTASTQGDRQPLPAVKRDTTRSRITSIPIRFQVTREEQSALCKRFKVDEKSLGAAIKKHVLQVAGSKVKPTKESTVDTREFHRLREIIKDPRILSKLQMAGLTSAAAIKRSDASALASAGLSEKQIPAVLRAIEKG